MVDHHTHLAPDDEPLDEAVVSIERIAAHAAAALEHGLDAVCVTEHIYRFRAARDAWDHPYWQQQAQWDIDAYWEALAEAKELGFPLRIGIECDWLGEGQEALDRALAGRPWDVLLGSVHWVDRGAVDYEPFSAFADGDPDRVWLDYADRYAAAALSGRFDVMTHVDLPKAFGPEPSAAARERACLVIADALEASDACVEISTAGLRKRARELYPAADLLALFAARGVPIVLSSDAHEPVHVGFAFDQARAAAAEAGYSEVMEFSGRERRAVPLG